MGLPRSVGGHKPHGPPRLGVLPMGPRKDGEDISFKEHFEEKLTSIENLESERWRAHREVHEMGQLALDAAVRALDVRLESMNEFRAQISQERSNFLPQQVYDTEHRALENKIDVKTEANEKRISVMEKWQSNMDGRFWMLGTLLTAVTISLNLAFRYFFGK